MATARKTKKVINVDKMTTDDAEKHLGEYAKAYSRKKELEGKIEQRIAKLREEFQGELNELTETMDMQYNTLEAFALQNRKLFVEKKSLDLLHGELGFRTGTPKLDKPKGITWDAMAGILRDKGGKDCEYVRVVEEVDKAALIRDRDVPETIQFMETCKLEVVQDETFFVKPKEEGTDKK